MNFKTYKDSIYSNSKEPFIYYFELKLLFFYLALVLGYIIKFVRLFFFSRSTTRINVNIVSKEKTASQYTLLYTYLSSCYVPLFSPFQNCSFRLNEIPFLPTILYSLDEKYSSNIIIENQIFALESVLITMLRVNKQKDIMPHPKLLCYITLLPTRMATDDLCCFQFL